MTPDFPCYITAITERYYADEAKAVEAMEAADDAERIAEQVEAAERDAAIRASRESK